MRSALHKKFLPPFKGGALDPLMIGLESYWALDELSGTRYDSIGSNDLTDNNTVTYVNDGPRGVNASFVRANTEYLEKAAGMNYTTFSVSCWFKDTLAATEVALITQDNVGANRDWDIYITAAGTLNVYYKCTTPILSATSFTGLDDSEWHLVTFEASVADSKLYVSVDNATPDEFVIDSGWVDPIGPFCVGIFGNHATNPMQGNISRIGFWSRKLTAGERTELYNSGRGKSYSDLSPGIKTNLVSYWNLDEVSGNRADSHGANTLTDNNSVWSVETGPEQVCARFVRASSEQLTLANYVFPASFTIAMWVKATEHGCPFLNCSLDFGNNIQVTLWLNNPNTFQLIVGDGASQQMAGSLIHAGAAIVNDGLYHLYLAWFDAADKTPHTSIDNGAIDSWTPGTPLGGVPYRVAQTLAIGGGTGGYQYFGGDIACAGIWNRVISVGERTAIFNGGISKKYSDLTAGEKSGLVNYWNLTELSGNRADSHGAGTLTDVNTVMSVINMLDVADKVCAKFEPTEYLNTANTPVASDAEFSLSFWNKPAVNGVSSVSLISWGTNDNTFIWVYNAGGEPWYYYQMTLGGVGNILSGFGDGTTVMWHHIVITYDPAGATKWNLIIDGKTPVTSNLVALPADPGFTIGTHTYDGKGLIDEVAVWSRALTPAECARLFNLGKGVFYPTFT